MTLKEYKKLKKKKAKEFAILTKNPKKYERELFKERSKK